jgi:hypothetical protein
MSAMGLPTAFAAKDTYSKVIWIRPHKIKF